MDRLDLDNRLSQIRTHWSAVLDAKATSSAGSPHAELVDRYLGATYRYLLGAVRDPDLAAELTQEFALRFLRGDFRGARPNRGRFRDYLRAVLVNLVNDAFRHRQRAPRQWAQLEEVAAVELPGDEDREFLASWREELLSCAWEALRGENPTYFAVLRLRVEEPDLLSPAMADRLTSVLGREFTAVNVRKTLERAQAKFAEVLFTEVGRSLHTGDPAMIEEELRVLDLLRYCRSAWERRRGKRTPEARESQGDAE